MSSSQSSPSSRSSRSSRRYKEPVLLNVYDLCNLNDYTIALGLGAFHSGIQLYGTEYGFGEHNLPETSGIFEMKPCKKKGELRANFRFRQSIFLGHTSLSKTELQRTIERLGRRQFAGRAYHIVSHNCNHFSIKLADILCGSTIPGWVNRLANLLALLPCLVHCLTPQHQRRGHQQRGIERLPEHLVERRPDQRKELCPKCRKRHIKHKD